MSNVVTCGRGWTAGGALAAVWAVLAALGTLLPARPTYGAVFDATTRDFAARLDLADVERLGVQDGGRVKVFDTFAREQLTALCGDDALDSLSPAFSYLELYLNAPAHLDAPLVRVGNEGLRRRLRPHLPPDVATTLERTRRLPLRYLLEPEGLTAMQVSWRGLPVGADLSAAQGARVHAALAEAAASEPAMQRARQKVLEAYFTFQARQALRMWPGRPEWRAPEALPGDCTLHGHEHASAADEHAALPALLNELGDAWRARDAERTNRLLRQWSAKLRQLDPSAQPPPARAWAELAYNRLYRFTVAWVGYALAFVLLLAAVVRPRRMWRRSGLTVMALSTLLLAAGFAIRWWLSGRPWYLPPVTGQFESVVGAALLGAAAALVMERFWARSYLALAGAFFALVALLLAFLLPQEMRPEIRPPQGILNNWILPLHVGTIILGYAMIAMGLVLSVGYLVHLARPSARQSGRARASGADLAAPTPPGRLAELDRSNLIVAQLACWLVGLGTILGAYWADYSWGRWWGWDPKEIWALITWLVYLAILHVRYVVPARSRGQWTAWLTILGAGVMLFNWVIVKYILPGLHSYG